MTEDKAIQGWRLTQEIKELTLKEENLNEILDQVNTAKATHTSTSLKLVFKAQTAWDTEVEVPDKIVEILIRTTLGQCRAELVNKKKMLANL